MIENEAPYPRSREGMLKGRSALEVVLHNSKLRSLVISVLKYWLANIILRHEEAPLS